MQQTYPHKRNKQYNDASVSKLHQSLTLEFCTHANKQNNTEKKKKKKKTLSKNDAACKGRKQFPALKSSC